MPQLISEYWFVIDGEGKESRHSGVGLVLSVDECKKIVAALDFHFINRNENPGMDFYPIYSMIQKVANDNR